MLTSLHPPLGFHRAESNKADAPHQQCLQETQPNDTPQHPRDEKGKYHLSYPNLSTGVDPSHYRYQAIALKGEA